MGLGAQSRGIDLDERVIGQPGSLFPAVCVLGLDRPGKEQALEVARGGRVLGLEIVLHEDEKQPLFLLVGPG